MVIRRNKCAYVMKGSEADQTNISQDVKLRKETKRACERGRRIILQIQKFKNCKRQPENIIRTIYPVLDEKVIYLTHGKKLMRGLSCYQQNHDDINECEITIFQHSTEQ